MQQLPACTASFCTWQLIVYSFKRECEFGSAVVLHGATERVETQQQPHLLWTPRAQPCKRMNACLNNE